MGTDATDWATSTPISLHPLLFQPLIIGLVALPQEASVTEIGSAGTERLMNKPPADPADNYTNCQLLHPYCSVYESER